MSKNKADLRDVKDKAIKRRIDSWERINGRQADSKKRQELVNYITKEIMPRVAKSQENQ